MLQSCTYILAGILKALDFESVDKQDTFKFFQHPLEVGKLMEFSDVIAVAQYYDVHFS